MKEFIYKIQIIIKYIMGKTIGQLPAASSLQLTDKLEIESASSQSITAQKIIDLVNQNLTLLQILVNGNKMSDSTSIQSSDSSSTFKLTTSYASIVNNTQILLDSPEITFPQLGGGGFNILSLTGGSGQDLGQTTLSSYSTDLLASADGIVYGQLYYNSTLHKLKAQDTVITDTESIQSSNVFSKLQLETTQAILTGDNSNINLTTGVATINAGSVIIPGAIQLGDVGGAATSVLIADVSGNISNMIMQHFTNDSTAAIGGIPVGGIYYNTTTNFLHTRIS